MTSAWKNIRVLSALAGLALMLFHGGCASGPRKDLSTINAPDRILYVDAFQGDDQNNGSLDKPFKTLQRARDEARKFNSNMTGDILIELRAGYYRLDDTLSFTSQDSGNNGYNVVYQAYNGEEVWVSGGQFLSDWKPASKGLYKTSAHGLRFRQLYVNGKPAVRARTPNRGTYARLLAWDDTDNKNVIIVNSADIPMLTLDKDNPPEFIAQLRYTAWRGRIEKIIRKGKLAQIVLMEPERHIMFNKQDPPKAKDDPFHLENALEFLDQPGEWYLDSSKDEIYYKPRAGENMEVVEVIAPKVTTLVSLTGTLDAPVHNIVFQGITFEHSNWLGPDKYGHVDHQADQWNLDFPNKHNYIGNILAHTEGAFSLNAAIGIQVLGCTFRNIGSVAIDLYNGSQNNVITGNAIYDIAGNGICDGAPAISPSNPKDARMLEKNNQFTNNYITRVGLDYMGAVAIMAGYTDGDVIEHNEIMDTPYTGISEGWGWSTAPSLLENVSIRYNHIMHTANSLCDTGGIYTLSNQPGTVIEGNYIHDAWLAPFADASGVNGVYLDDGSMGITVKNNDVINYPSWLNGTVEKHVKDGNIFGTNYFNQLVPSIVANAGLEPQYQTLREAPVPSSWPGVYRSNDPLSLEFSYVKGWDIHYTLNGSDPAATSPSYTGPIQITAAAAVKAVAVNPSGKLSGVFSGSYNVIPVPPVILPVLEEKFGKPFNPGWGSIMDAHLEQIRRSDITGFGWGGFTPKSCDYVPDPLTLTAMNDEDQTILLDIGMGGDENQIQFKSWGKRGTGCTKGAYVYSIFSANGDNTPTTSVDMKTTAFQIQFEGNAAFWINDGLKPDSPWPAKIRFLMRDSKGNWYLSTPKTALTVAKNGVFSPNLLKMRWQKVSTANREIMNAFKGNGPGPGLLKTSTEAAKPDFTKVSGFGVYLDSVASEVSYIKVQRLSWLPGK